MTNVMLKTYLNQPIIKNSNLIQAMKNNVCPKAIITQTPNFSQNRICPKIYRMFRSVDWTHDMIIVKWREVTAIQFFRKPNLSEYLPNVPKCGLNTRHDNREVTLIHLTRAQTWRSDKCATGSIPRKRVNDYQRYSMLGAHVYVLYPRQFIFVLSCRRHHFCKYYNPQSARKDILKHFFCIWCWQMLWLKHVLTRKL